MDDNNVVDGLPVISLWSKSRAADNSEDNADNMSEGSHGITPVPTPRGMRQKPVSSHSASTSPVPHNKKQVHPAAESAQEIDPNLQLDSKLQNGNTLLLRLNRYLSGTSHVPVRAAAVTLRHHEVDTGGARISGTLQRLMIGLGTILVPAVARKQSGETSNITVDASFTPPSAATEELPAPRHCVLAHETADTSPGCDSTTPPLANDKAETVETAKNNHSADSNVHSYISGWLEHRTHNKVYVADK